MDERYRIHVVAAQTGVPEATLRAWERRYQVPMPKRTPSGYRLYSVRDVLQVKQIRALCEAGMSPAEAAQRVAESPPERPLLDDVSAASDVRSVLRFVESLTVEAHHKQGVASASDIATLIDKAATIVASRHNGRPMLVVQSDKLQLYCAARHGDLVEVVAGVVDANPHLLTVEVTCTIERLALVERELLTRTRVGLVPLDSTDHLDQR